MVNGQCWVCGEYEAEFGGGGCTCPEPEDEPVKQWEDQDDDVWFE